MIENKNVYIKINIMSLTYYYMQYIDCYVLLHIIQNASTFYKSIDL